MMPPKRLDPVTPPESSQTSLPASPTSAASPAEPWIDSKTLLGQQGVVLIHHAGLTYRLQTTRFGKLLLTK